MPFFLRPNRLGHIHPLPPILSGSPMNHPHGKNGNGRWELWGRAGIRHRTIRAVAFCVQEVPRDGLLNHSCPALQRSFLTWHPMDSQPSELAFDNLRQDAARDPRRCKRSPPAALRDLCVKLIQLSQTCHGPHWMAGVMYTAENDILKDNGKRRAFLPSSRGFPEEMALSSLSTIINSKVLD